MSSDSAIDELKLCQNGEASVEDEKLHRPDPDTIVSLLYLEKYF